jgi:hypothetical protein
MIENTPPVKNCVDQYKNVNSVLDTPIFPTPTPAVNPYAPSAADSDKIKDAITILERVARSQNNTQDRESIERVIQQLNTDLMYLKIKNNG